LPEKNRVAIRYVKIEGLSVAEAAARCGISESAVKINVHRGLKALSAAIAQDKRNEN
jgi:RNA polymerase sigma-70 factor (ECF subfamily)